MKSTTIPIDLHCHSLHSDGAHSISEVIDLAKANGCQYLSLTDHDTIAGIEDAKLCAHDNNINLISGVEISVTWESNSLIHILGLGIDATNKLLIDNLNTLRSQRLTRGQKIADNLAKIGIEGALDGALKYCSKVEALSRTHFARFLVDNNYAKPGKAFDKFLAPGKPGYVTQKWATLEDALHWITMAGGIAVIAHPARYKFTRTKLLKLIGQFKELGGRGIEVRSSSHSESDVQNIAQISKMEKLLASVGSDFHNLNESYRTIKVGVNPSLPSICEPIFSELGIPELC